MAKRASDKVKNLQIRPHSKLQYEFVFENIPFKKLDFYMFIAGEKEILTSKISKTEYKGRIRLLKKMLSIPNYMIGNVCSNFTLHG